MLVKSESTIIGGLRPTVVHRVLRIFAAIVGGYLFTWGVSAFGVVALVKLGVDFHSAEVTMLMFAFLLYLVVFLWAFVARSLIRVYGVFILGGVSLCAVAWYMQVGAIHV